MDLKTVKGIKKEVINTLSLKPTKGIPIAWLHIMQHDYIERIAGVKPGDYVKNPEKIYLQCQKAIGVDFIDQYIPTNPLTMESHGFENKERGATTGAESIVCDGILIDSPEAVVEHMETVVFPQIRSCTLEFNEEQYCKQILENELKTQQEFGVDILKTGYGFASFPYFAYGTYGYVNYFMAYALYPEVIENHFSLQADLALAKNKAAALAYKRGELPPLYRLDHDMADSRGTLVNIKTLDKIWLPHFIRCIEPLVKAGVKLIWHCDGNLMELIPRLLEAGIKGFQGFQYEDNMDYEKICSMKTRDREDLLIWAGVSVTRTLPFGKPKDVKRELEWLVEKGPKAGLFLGLSSSMIPGVPWENVETLIEGLKYYQKNGGLI
jgi:hypothetical protein